MPLKHDKTLITGKPGVGKTTLIQTVVDRIKSIHTAGFVTSEIRSKGVRRGFELRGFDGRRRTLAHVDIDSRQRVGRYGVDVAGFDAFLEFLDVLGPDVALIVIDEIGRMELFSNRFRRLIGRILDGDTPLLASIALKGDAFVQSIKQRPGIHLFEVTRENRDRLVNDIILDVNDP